MTFLEYSNLFIEKYCIPNVSKITTKGYKDYIKVMIPYIGNYKLNKITSYMLDNMYNKIKKGQKGKELTSKTMLHYFDLVNLMLKQAKNGNLLKATQTKTQYVLNYKRKKEISTI